MANAHRWRHGNMPDCKFCQVGPKEARRLHLYRNHNGHRHNSHSKKRGKRPKR
jgi:hypothetical protein